MIRIEGQGPREPFGGSKGWGLLRSCAQRSKIRWPNALAASVAAELPFFHFLYTKFWDFVTIFIKNIVNQCLVLSDTVSIP